MALSTNHRAIRWLRAQLPELVGGGVITAESASAIDRHYAAAEARSTNFGFVILAGIGSTLVGAGVILLIAHNWDELSRPVRCVLAFLPLVSALALGLYVLLRRNDLPAWREAAAIFDVAAVGTAISLVSDLPDSRQLCRLHARLAASEHPYRLPFPHEFRRPRLHHWNDRLGH